MNVSDLHDLGSDSHAFTVVYTDASGINGATLDNRDVVVTGPNEFRQEATLVSADNTDGGKRWMATYQIGAPDSQWDASDAGTYAISLQPDAVLDSNGYGTGGGVLGGFAFAPDGQAVATVPYVPRSAEISITPPPSRWYSDGSNVIRVDLNLPHPGFRVAD